MFGSARWSRGKVKVKRWEEGALTTISTSSLATWSIRSSVLSLRSWLTGDEFVNWMLDWSRNVYKGRQSVNVSCRVWATALSDSGGSGVSSTRHQDRPPQSRKVRLTTRIKRAKGSRRTISLQRTWRRQRHSTLRSPHTGSSAVCRLVEVSRRHTQEHSPAILRWSSI